MQYLDSNQKSWLEISRLPDNLIQFINDNFDKMYSYHPDTRAKVIMYDTEVDCSRWQQSYLDTPAYTKSPTQSYMFSGKTNDTKSDIPPEFKVILDFINEDRSIKYNQVTVNWYKNGADYIAYHSDYTAGLKSQDIEVVNLVESEDVLRKFCVKSKTKPTKKVEIPLYNGAIIKMCGDTQKDYRHGVPKVDANVKNNTVPRRISLSFRSFSS